MSRLRGRDDALDLHQSILQRDELLYILPRFLARQHLVQRLSRLARSAWTSLHEADSRAICCDLAGQFGDVVAQHALLDESCSQ